MHGFGRLSSRPFSFGRILFVIAYIVHCEFDSATVTA